MAARSFTTLGSAAVITGIATLAFAAPASAQYPKDPDGARIEVTTQNPPPTIDDGWQFGQVASGALGGIVLAGVGVGAAAGLRRHNRHLAHPA